MTSSPSLESRPPSRCRCWAISTGERRGERRGGSSILRKGVVHDVKPCLSLSLSSKTDRVAKGSECFQRSLTLNPFLWSPFQNLCHLGKTHAHTHFHHHVLMCLNVCSRRKARSRAGVQIVIDTEHFNGCPPSPCQPCSEHLPPSGHRPHGNTAGHTGTSHLQ